MNEGDVLTELENQIGLASRLPLLDAAFSLWLYDMCPRRPKDAFDFQRENITGSVDWSDHTAAHKAASAIVKFKYANAHVGPAFHWLKRAHPNASDEALRNAIRAAVKFDQDCAVKFDQDCVRFFPLSGNLWEDSETAVSRASDENPGFTEPTLKSARERVCFAMR